MQVNSIVGKKGFLSQRQNPRFQQRSKPVKTKVYDSVDDSTRPEVSDRASMPIDEGKSDGFFGRRSQSEDTR